MYSLSTTTALISSRESPAKLLLFAWFVVVLATYLALVAYSSKPGPSDQWPDKWPAGSWLKPEPGRYNLIMFAHPRCPCTLASLSELARLTARCPTLAAKVVFYHPANTSEQWAKTESWRQSCRIPNVQTSTDNAGREAARFQASTSGEVVVYSPHGKLVFGGGITPGRGHEGDNAGIEAIASIVRGEQSDIGRSQVFGCSLLDQTTCVQKGDK